MLTHYGTKCQCCGEKQVEFLTIDHINNDGNKHRKETNYSNIYSWLRQNDYPKQRTKIVHCKREKYDVYIGRPSDFENKYRIGPDGTREEVIEKYKVYFYKRLENDPVFKAKVRNLAGCTISCWCKPKACHGDIIIEYLEGLDDE